MHPFEGVALTGRHLFRPETTIERRDRSWSNVLDRRELVAQYGKSLSHEAMSDVGAKSCRNRLDAVRVVTQDEPDVEWVLVS